MWSSSKLNSLVSKSLNSGNSSAASSPKTTKEHVAKTIANNFSSISNYSLSLVRNTDSTFFGQQHQHQQQQHHTASSGEGTRRSSNGSASKQTLASHHYLRCYRCRCRIFLLSLSMFLLLLLLLFRSHRCSNYVC